MNVSKVSEQLIDLILPCACAGCGRAGGEVLCGRCMAGLASRCNLYHQESLTLPSGQRSAVSAVRAAGPYLGALKEIVLKLKSSYRASCAPLAKLMVVAAGNDPRYLVPDQIMFVPSERRKVVERGYNPAELLARTISRLLGRPLCGGLVKVRRTEDQDRLSSRERWENIAGAFDVRAGFRPGESVLLIDDVLTTGATVNECALTLLRTGALCVHVLVAARA